VEYNEERPDSSVGYQTPEEFANDRSAITNRIGIKLPFRRRRALVVRVADRHFASLRDGKTELLQFPMNFGSARIGIFLD